MHHAPTPPTCPPSARLFVVPLWNISGDVIGILQKKSEVNGLKNVCRTNQFLLLDHCTAPQKYSTPYFFCNISVLSLYWNQMLRVNKCKSWKSLSKLLHKISASRPRCSEIPKISAVKLVFCFTVHACQISGHSGLWTHQRCQLAVLSDEPVRPISSNIFQSPRLTLKTWAACAVGNVMQTHRIQTPKPSCWVFTARVQKTAIKCGQDKGLGSIAPRALAISMERWICSQSSGI